MRREFIHLHLHSEHSKFDGVSKVKQLVQVAADKGMVAMALTDHGAVSGWAELHDHCHQNGILPIFGLEAYMVDDVEIRARQPRRHLCLLAVNNKGYANLVKLASLSAMYFFYKPVLDINLLAQHSEGIVATTACLGGWCARPFFSQTGYDGCGTPERGIEQFEALREVFGDRLYGEIQPYESDSQRVFNEFMFACAAERGWQLVATNDVHYALAEDADFQRAAILSQVQRWAKNGDGYNDMVDRYVNKPGGHHIRTRREMVDAFTALHGVEIQQNDHFWAAMEAPWDVYRMASAVRFDTDTKIPVFPLD